MITNNIELAKQALNNDALIAMPTETVYGLAGNAYKPSVVEQIFALKKRPHYNPLIVHIKSAIFLPQVAADIPPMAYALAAKFWPGPLTLILKKQPHIPDLVTAGKDTVAVRVPAHPLTLQLLDELDFPLAAPSANPFGSVSPTTAAHVEQYFADELPVILDGGACEKGLESTIIGFEEGQPVLYRLGALSQEDIELITGTLAVRSKNDTDPAAPGMLSRHYSPATPTLLTADVKALAHTYAGKKIGLLLFTHAAAVAGVAYTEVLSASGDLNEAARNLYAALHRLDKQGLDLIIAECFPHSGLGNTINDRLQRAVQPE